MQHATADNPSPALSPGLFFFFPFPKDVNAHISDAGVDKAEHLSPLFPLSPYSLTHRSYPFDRITVDRVLSPIQSPHSHSCIGRKGNATLQFNLGAAVFSLHQHQQLKGRVRGSRPREWGSVLLDSNTPNCLLYLHHTRRSFHFIERSTDYLHT